MNKKKIITILTIIIILNIILYISYLLPNDIFSIVEIIYIFVMAILIGYKIILILSIILLILINILLRNKKVFLYSILEVIIYIIFLITTKPLEIMVEYNENLEILKQFITANIGIVFDIIFVLLIINIIKSIKKPKTIYFTITPTGLIQETTKLPKENNKKK